MTQLNKEEVKRKIEDFVAGSSNPHFDWVDSGTAKSIALYLLERGVDIVSGTIGQKMDVLRELGLENKMVENIAYGLQDLIQGGRKDTVLEELRAEIGKGDRETGGGEKTAPTQQALNSEGSPKRGEGAASSSPTPTNKPEGLLHRLKPSPIIPGPEGIE